MAYGDRKSGRVDFERGVHVFMMGIDGTWRRECTMIDVSQTGARLQIDNGRSKDWTSRNSFCCFPRPAWRFAAVRWCVSTVNKSGSSSWRETPGPKSFQ